MEDEVQQGRRPRGRGKQRPCDFCRLRKIACILKSQPPCVKCEKSGRSCTFEKDPPPRAPGGSTQSGYEVDNQGGLSLEQLQVPLDYDWEVTSFRREISIPFDSMYDTYAPIGLPTSAIDPSSPAHLSAYNNSMSFSLPGEHTDRGMEFEHTDDRLRQNTPRLSNPSSTQLLDSNFSSRYLGLTSETDPILRQRYKYDEAGYRLSKFRGFRNLDPAAKAPSVMLLTPLQVSRELADCVVPQPLSTIVQDLSEYGNILIGLFNRFVEPYYPVLSFSDLKPDDKCKSLLAMVYSMALPWRSYDPNLPWVQFNAKPMTRAQLPDQDKMHQFAWSEISREMHAPDYSTISACLLLMERKRSHIFVADSSFDTCLVAITKSLAFSLGLHIDCESWNIDPNEKSKRRLLWWLVYVQDIWTSTAHGQPPNIRSDESDVPLLSYNQHSISLNDQPAITHEPTEANWEISATFLHLLELTRVLDDIHHSLL
jgi:Fungal specific transcription factor domain/Fungal Zn(2)-Cys(6) binuclear cluster domain